MAIRKKGNKYQVDVTVKGTRAPRVSCETLVEAQKVEAEFRARLLAGEAPEALSRANTSSNSNTGTVTLAHLVDATYAAQWRGTKSEENALRNANSWCEALGYDYPVFKFDPQAFSDVCDGWAAAGLAPGTINRKIAALSVMLNIAEERQWIEKKFKLRRKKEYEGRLRYFTDEEVNSLLDYARNQKRDPELAALFEVAVGTGMRQGELLKMTKRDLNWHSRVIMLGETKGDKRRSVPMTERVVEVLKGVTKSGSLKDHQKVFPDRISSRSISRVICAWKVERELPADDEACFHTFRHTCCSRLIMAGVNPVVAQKWMGHASIQTTMNYIHLAPDAFDSALSALNNWKGN